MWRWLVSQDQELRRVERASLRLECALGRFGEDGACDCFRATNSSDFNADTNTESGARQICLVDAELARLAVWSRQGAESARLETAPPAAGKLGGMPFIARALEHAGPTASMCNDETSMASCSIAATLHNSQAAVHSQIVLRMQFVSSRFISQAERHDGPSSFAPRACAPPMAGFVRHRHVLDLSGYLGGFRGRT